MLPSDVAFYTQIIQFLDCIKLGEKFTGQAPNGYHIITHGKNGFGDDVQFVYDSFTKKISENELDLYDTQTGLTDYRVLMGVADEEIVSVATGDQGETMTCFVVERKNSFCAARVDYFVELLGKNIVQIGCAPGVQRRANYVYDMNGNFSEKYDQKTNDQFNCNSTLGVFGDHIVFKNGSCKQLNWADSQHRWNAEECDDKKYTLNSKNFELFSMSYLTIKFATGQCAEPTELSAQALANTYIKSLFLSPEEEEALNTTPEPEPEPQTEATPSNAGWYVFGAGLFLVLSLSIAAAVVLIRKRAKKSVLDRNPLTHVRYDFGLPTQVPALQQKNDRFKEVKLDNGYVVPIPETFCKEYGDVELVSKSQFGLIYKYQWKGPIHVKFEVKLSGYNQPILNEVAICELCTNSDNKLARFLDYKGAYGFYEEGAYALHLSAGVHTLRDLRNGAVMKDVEMAKVAYSALDCVDALEAFGICHRDITEDAFRPQKSIFVLTELGWAVRLGSKRDPYYPHPELASTFIKEKETLPADDAENVIFMLLNMMTDRLPWADTKGIKSITKKKKKFFEECMDGTSLKNNKTAGILCKLRAMIVKTPRNVELAVELKAELINLSKPDDPTLPVEWPGSNDKPTTKSFL